MSHFVVVVIGDKWEEQLAPYDERISVEPYEDSEGDKSTYNPKSRWDWYEMGGRWRGYFPLKPGGSGVVGQPGAFENEAAPGTADQVRMGDVDIARAMREREARARERFGKWAALWEKVGPTYRKTVSWDTCIESAKLNGETVDLARRFYHNQPLIEAAAKHEDLKWLRGCYIEEYGFDEEKYVAECMQNVLTPHAFVIGGHWIQQGRMRWFAMVDEETSAADWSAFCRVLYSQIDPDTIITAVDCHI